MGAMLLLPSYFLQVRGQGTLNAGLLLAPQGLGAMFTMPIAGRLTDKIGPGKLGAGRDRADRDRSVGVHPGRRGLVLAAGSIGTAVMSVILTNQVLASPAASAYSAVTQGGAPSNQLPPDVLSQGQSSLADAFGSTYTVALMLIILCVVPALFLPRRAIDAAVEQEKVRVPVAMH
jgi:MFS family permease